MLCFTAVSLVHMVIVFNILFSGALISTDTHADQTVEFLRVSIKGHSVSIKGHSNPDPFRVPKNHAFYFLTSHGGWFFRHVY